MGKLFVVSILGGEWVVCCLPNLVVNGAICCFNLGGILGFKLTSLMVNGIFCFNHNTWRMGLFVVVANGAICCFNHKTWLFVASTIKHWWRMGLFVVVMNWAICYLFVVLNKLGGEWGYLLFQSYKHGGEWGYSQFSLCESMWTRKFSST